MLLVKTDEYRHIFLSSIADIDNSFVFAATEIEMCAKIM